MIIFFLFSFLFFKDLIADDFPKIYGCFCEGGIITGKIHPLAKVKINGDPIEVFDNGIFIYAFGRKFTQKVKIEINSFSKEYLVSDKTYKVEQIRGLPRNTVDPNKSELERILSDQKKIKYAKKIGSKSRLFEKNFILPSKGRLSGFYGSQRILNSKPRKPHAGIDIAAKEGTPVIAPSSGKIKLVEKNMFFTGNTVILDHGLGLISIFAHLKDISISEDQNVTKGDLIGSIGMTGRATGPHLHWGVYLKNISVDPMALLDFELY